jgi:hypothetical protein
MRPRALKLALALAPLLAVAACQQPDVGERCTLSWGTDPATPPPRPDTTAADFFETGNTACEDLVCIVSAAPAESRYGQCEEGACGYCSKPCVSNQDCYTGDTGLVCGKVVLDDAFLAALDDATRARFLNEVASSSYCVIPR